MDDFSQFNLDLRILRAIEDLGWTKPTEIQREALPLAINNEHLLIRSRTGSGKTAIYLITIFNKLLTNKYKKFKALIFAPSNELCSQIYDFTRGLAKYAALIRPLNLAAVANPESTTIDDFNIIIATPSRAAAFLANYPFPAIFKFLIFDEADLLFTFGHENALRMLANSLPNRLQIIILSATLNENIENLISFNLINPRRVISSHEPFPDSCQLSQYLIKCEPTNRFLIIYSLFSLNLISGKTLIFTNNTNNSYRLFLFFKVFGINSVVLNGELPINTRKKALEKFSRGKVKILISTDIIENDNNEKNNNENKKNEKIIDFSLSRGIDLACIDNVINFDFPFSITNYIHRVGRTARVNSVGLAFTFYTNEKELVLQELREFVDKNSNSKLLPFKFKMDLVEGFRYRVEDAMKSITKSAIFNARKAEIKDEIYNSEKVKEHFKKKPSDKLVLKNKFNKKANQMDHLKRIPEYLIPEGFKKIIQPKVENTTDFNVNRRKEFMKKKFKKLRQRRKDPFKLPSNKTNTENI